MTKIDSNMTQSGGDEFCPLARRGVRAKLGGIRFRSLFFSDPRPELRFWHVLPEPVIGERACRLLPLGVNEWTRHCFSFRKTGPTWPQQAVLDVEAKSMREMMLAQFWTSYVTDEFDFANAIQTNAAFSYASTVMDSLGGCICTWKSSETTR